MKDPAKDWEALIKSIKKAAHRLNEDLTERDMPDYMNWFAGRTMHSNLWARVYARKSRKNA